MKEFLFAPTILFLLIVAPIWLTMHYRYKSKMIKGISEQEQAEIDDMLETIDKLAARVDTLEDILDRENKHWREQNGEEAKHE